MKIALISPRFHSRYFWDFRTAAAILRRKSNNLLLALPTVAALTPEEHEVVLIDDAVETIDYNAPVDLVGITAMTCYSNRAYEIAAGFRERGVPVVIGGSHATLVPYEAHDHADAVIVGEAENVWAALLEDLGNGRMKSVYRGVDAKPDMASQPAPRWCIPP